MEILKEQGSL